jgi:four helix bundle protein
MEWRRLRETIGCTSAVDRLTIKPQIPKPKHQGRSKSPIEGKTCPAHFSYDRTSVPITGWVVNDGDNDNATPKHPFDLEERTALFGETIVRFCKRIPRDPTNDRLIGQLAGCGTSVGANYCEAEERVSKKDFHNIIRRCVKEAKESKHFLRMVAAAEPCLAEEARELYREARELHLIFASIYRKRNE